MSQRIFPQGSAEALALLPKGLGWPFLAVPKAMMGLWVPGLWEVSLPMEGCGAVRGFKVPSNPNRSVV